MSKHACPCLDRVCLVCGGPLIQRESETDYLFVRREVCGSACYRTTKMTPSQAGKMRWIR